MNKGCSYRVSNIFGQKQHFMHRFALVVAPLRDEVWTLDYFTTTLLCLLACLHLVSTCACEQSLSVPWTCILPNDQQGGDSPGCKKEVRWKNDPTSHLIYDLSKKFMASIASFKSSSIQHDVHLENYNPTECKTDDKTGYALGRGYSFSVNLSSAKKPQDSQNSDQTVKLVVTKYGSRFCNYIAYISPEMFWETFFFGVPFCYNPRKIAMWRLPLSKSHAFPAEWIRLSCSLSPTSSTLSSVLCVRSHLVLADLITSGQL